MTTAVTRFAAGCAVALATAAAAAGTGGCNKTTRDVREGATAGVRLDDEFRGGQALEYNTVHIKDRALQEWRGPREKDKGSAILVQKTNASLNPTGTVKAWAILENRTEQPLALQGRVLFFKRDESPLEDPGAWRVFHVPPLGVYNFEESSLRTVDQVGYYYIEIRRAS
jgi:hypothetical protein